MINNTEGIPYEKSYGDSQLIRFGVFEIDLRAGELHKNGLKVKLQEQPFQILALLLEHPGKIVTREELQQKLGCVVTRQANGADRVHSGVRDRKSVV